MFTVSIPPAIALLAIFLLAGYGFLLAIDYVLRFVLHATLKIFERCLGMYQSFLIWRQARIGQGILQNHGIDYSSLNDEEIIRRARIILKRETQLTEMAKRDQGRTYKQPSTASSNAKKLAGFISLCMAIALFPNLVHADKLKTRMDWCFNSPREEVPNLRIGACTWLLKSGHLEDDHIPIAIYYRATAHYEKGDHVNAIKDYNEAIQLKPDFPEAVYNRGVVYGHKGDYENAMKDFNEAIKLKPDFPQAFYNRGVVYGRKGDHDNTIRDYNEAIKLKPDFPEAVYNRGVAYMDKGDYDDAIKDYNQAIKLKPDLALAFNNRSLIYKHQGDYDKAMKDLNEAIRLKPDFAGSFHNRSLIYKDQGDYDKAIKDLNEAINLKPDFPEAFIDRGALYMQKGESDNAIKDFNEAIKLKPDNHETFHHRGTIYFAINNYDKAIADYTAALKIKPDYKPTLVLYAWLLATVDNSKYRDPQMAVQLANKAIELKAITAFVYNILAAAHAANGNFKAAQNVQQKAMEKMETTFTPEEKKSYFTRLKLYQSNKAVFCPKNVDACYLR